MIRKPLNEANYDLYALFKRVREVFYSLLNKLANSEYIINNNSKDIFDQLKKLENFLLIINDYLKNFNENQDKISSISDKYIINLKTNEYLSDKIKNIKQKQAINKINIDNILDNINIDEDPNNNNNNIPKKIFSLPLSKREGKQFNYKYTLFIELDETIVHYYEEGENYFVKVRQGTEDFLKTMNTFCEIIIVSTSSEEYTDIILDNLNKDKKYIDNAIYKDLCDSNNIIIDFTKINRDNKKSIFICHNKNEFFNVPDSNVIELKEFNGEEEDKEIIYLQAELIKLNSENINDVRYNINDIKEIIKQKRIEQEK